MSERTLEEQFAALPPRVKSHLFAVLDRVIGLSQDEKATTQLVLDYAATSALPEPVPKLMKALSGLVFAAETEADPELRRVHDMVDDLVESLSEDMEEGELGG